MSRHRQEPSRSAFVPLALALWISSSSALAAGAPADAPGPSDEDRDSAKQFAADGRALFWKEEYEASIKAFKGAYALVSDPNLLFNIATAYEKLGRFDEAIEYLDRYAAEAPADEAEAIADMRARLEAGKEQAAAASRQAPPDEPEPEVVEPSAPAVIQPPVTDPALDTPPQPPLMGALGWSLLSGNIAALAVGVGFGVSAGAASAAGEAECSDVDGLLICPESARHDLERARSRALVADVSFGLAAAAAVATVVVVGVRVARRKSGRERRARLSLDGPGFRLHF